MSWKNQIAIFLFTSLCSCQIPSSEKPPSPKIGEEIIVCGKRYNVGTPVILWFEPGGFDAYLSRPAFASQGPIGLRYQPGRSFALPAEAGTNKELDLETLKDGVDLFVLHYDASGFSKRCFRALQDERQLSVHFFLDVDGTIYQSLDLREQAWHATKANPRSIGIEITNLGVFAPEDPSLDEWKKRDWYLREDGRLKLSIPASVGDPGILQSGPFYAARSEFLRGEINGRDWEQIDFTPQQYEALVKLTAVLLEIFPKIAAEFPRDTQGRVKNQVLEKTEFESFQGILGHYHVQPEKNDPGPAFDWEKFLTELRKLQSVKLVK